jgi:hypothetical protein
VRVVIFSPKLLSVRTTDAIWIKRIADPFNVRRKLVEHLVEDSLISHRGPADFIAVGAQFSLLKPIPVERIMRRSRDWRAHVCVVVDEQLEIISAPKDDYQGFYKFRAVCLSRFTNGSRAW